MAAAGLVIRAVGEEAMPAISQLNLEIFRERRIINSFDRQDLVMFLAELEGHPVGFKVGYRQNRLVFYSAKGGVLESFRGHGIANALLDRMLRHAKEAGYRKFAFDTFPNMHPGMTVLALKRGFRLVQAEFNDTYGDFRLRFEAVI
jgi:GNAT superfamily N-acetyltransferase